MKCDGCKEAYEEIRKLEDKQDRFHSEYKDKVHEYELDKVTDRATLKAVHTRIDTMAEDNREMKEDNKKTNEALINHMKEESEQHEKVNEALTTILTNMPHLATKTEVETQKGRLNTMLRLGVFAFLIISIIGGLILWYIKEDIKSHTTKASIINEKKIVESIKGD